MLDPFIAALWGFMLIPFVVGYSLIRIIEIVVALFRKVFKI
jgi:hypothetical protein